MELWWNCDLRNWNFIFLAQVNYPDEIYRSGQVPKFRPLAVPWGRMLTNSDYFFRSRGPPVQFVQGPLCKTRYLENGNRLMALRLFPIVKAVQI